MHKYREAFKRISLVLAIAVLIMLSSCCGQESTLPTPTPTGTPGGTIASITPIGTISSPTGEVLVQKLGSETWIEAATGMKLEVGDRLKTGSDGYTLILFFDGSVMEVDADSEIIIEELSIAADTGSTTIRLRQMIGTTVNRVEQLIDPASQYEVETPAGSAVVRGTIFEVRVLGNGFTMVKSIEGDMWFTAGGVTVLVSEGMHYGAWPGGIPFILYGSAGDGGGGGGTYTPPAENLDLKLSVDTPWVDEVAATWTGDNMAPGDDLGYAAIRLRNFGAITPDHLEISCNYTVTEVWQEPDTEDTSLVPDNMAKYLEITLLRYEDDDWYIDCLTGEQRNSVTNALIDFSEDWRVDNTDGVPGVSLCDLRYDSLDNLPPPDVSHEFSMGLKFRDDAGNNLNGDILILTVYFTLNQEISQ